MNQKSEGNFEGRVEKALDTIEKNQEILFEKLDKKNLECSANGKLITENRTNITNLRTRIGFYDKLFIGITVGIILNTIGLVYFFVSRG